MAYAPAAQRLLTADDMEFLRTVPDDTEEAPWMVMGDAQFWSATDFAWSLRLYAEERGLPWYVAGMLPILFRRPGRRRKGQIAPDVLVAHIPRRERPSYDLEAEGSFPPFVLEVISPSSKGHDITAKRRTYTLLGAQEYALFSPSPGLLSPQVQGYRRDAGGNLEPWLPDAEGRLWSDVLGLFLAAEGGLLRAVEANGQPLPTRQESEAARQRAEAERRRAEAEREAEATARRRAEEEVARLRALLGRDAGDDRLCPVGEPAPAGAVRRP